MSDVIADYLNKKMAPLNHPRFHSGDTVNVHVRVKEGEKERIQVFKGVVIKVQGSGFHRTFTVRKISSGVGVERIFPMSSPAIEKVRVVSRGKVRRGRLFYLRGLRGRAARLESDLVQGGKENSKKKKQKEATDGVPPQG